MKKILKYDEYIAEGKYEEDHELNRILDKISASGIDSLTPNEKRYLDGGEEEEEVQEEEDSFIDEYGDYIPAKKDSFLLKIIDDASIEGDIKYKTVAVYDKNGKYVVDIHFCDMFPELEDINLCDMAEGAMEYEGRLTASELVDKLKQMGFNTIIE